MLISQLSSSLYDLGHVHFPSSVSIQFIDKLKLEILRLVAKQNPSSHDELDKLESNVMSYGTGWTFQENLWRFSPRLRRLFLKGELPTLASNLLRDLHSVDGPVALLRDQTYFKKPFSEATPWHQDGTFVPLPDMKSLTFWIPFHDIDDSFSPMHYVDASHKQCWLGSTSRLVDESQKLDDFTATLNDFRAYKKNITVYDQLKKGDLLIHDTWTLHGSPQHSGNSSRFAIVIVYYLLTGEIDLCPSIRLHNPINSGQAKSLRLLNKQELFPDIHTSVLGRSNYRTPTVHV